MRTLLFVTILMMGLYVFPVLAKGEKLPISLDEIPTNQVVAETTKSTMLSRLFQTPLHFVANQGQFHEEVVYYAKSEGATVYCTEQGLVFGFAEGSISLNFSEDRRVKPKSWRLRLQARGELKGKVNYFIGNDPNLWRTDIPTFKEVVYPEVYTGIDLVYSGDQRRLKYTFYLQPHSDPDQILMIYDGIESLWVDDATGELVIQTPWGKMRDAAPVAYQEIEGVRKEVDISFRLPVPARQTGLMGEKIVAFALGDYDPNFMLTLDPGYSTYIGGSGEDVGYGIALDSAGNAYVAGETRSSNFPTITNNTIFGNSGAPGGGIICTTSSFPRITNTIFWNNYPNEIYTDGTSSITITYSDIQGGWAGEGNIDVEPLFVDPDNNDYRLNDYSPCIGAGIMTPDVPVTDIEGNSRPKPAGSNPDIGAYENNLGVAILRASALEKISGDYQSVDVSGDLPEPMVVRVLDQYSKPMSGITVTFSPGEGTSVNPTQATTDANGQAQTIVTLIRI